MKALPLAAAALLLIAVPGARGADLDDTYVPGPDSKPQPGVPKGELIPFDFAASKVFPGTTRRVTVYVPRQYDPAKPACVYVDQDGVQFEAPVVLDNLIARGELPVIIGVFVTPGIVPPLHPAKELPRFNRSLEYDGLGDAYERLIVDEVLPMVETKATSDGRPVHLSHDGKDRAIGGSSSGAIAAFNAAWEHPEAFSRVLSAIGTYVGLRGADRYPTLIRKYEPKPIRVFLQDGSSDLNIYAGDWWMANQTMERALEFGGYEVNHAWGEGHHSGRQITSLLPDALRWLWKDWPKPVARGTSQNGALKALLSPCEGWHDTSLTGPNLATDTRGMCRGTEALVRYGPDETKYETDGPTLKALRADGSAFRAADGIWPRDFVVGHNGLIYATEPGAGSASSSVWLIRPGGRKELVDTGLLSATGITLSPDQSLLYVADGASHWVYSYQVQADGTLANKQRYYWLHSLDTEDASHAAALCCDRAGWLYVATDLGIQVCDQAGRVNAILPLPGGRPAKAVAFAGPKFDTLFVISGSVTYRRCLNAVAANPWAEPVLPPAPHL